MTSHPGGAAADRKDMSDQAVVEAEDTAGEETPPDFESPAPEPAPETAPDPAPAPAPAPAPRSHAGIKLVALWLPMPSRRRLLDLDVELVESVGDKPDLVVASTRGPESKRNAITEFVDAGIPVVVACHPGGEAIAVELVAFGASTVVAEGSEGAAVRVVTGDADSQLLDSYRDGLERPEGAGQSPFDPVTGLLGRARFEARLLEMGVDSAIPRLMIAAPAPGTNWSSLGPSGEANLRRRLATLIVGLVGHHGCEVFDLGGGRFGILAQELPLDVSREVGTDISRLAAGFFPHGEPIAMAVGSAGPESGADLMGLHSIADRALQEAHNGGGGFVDAAEMSEHSGGLVEMAAAYAVADQVDAFDPAGTHSVRVSELALRLAREFELDPERVAIAGLAGRLHDLGKVGFGAAAFDDAEPDHAKCVAEHAARGKAYVLPLAGTEVADAIAAHHERFDGTGPLGLTGEDIPIEARIVAVADRVDRMTGGRPLDPDAIGVLREEAGTSLDPNLVELAIAALTV